MSAVLAPCIRSDGKRAGSAAREAVERVLRKASYLALRSVRCEVEGDALILKGSVPSYYLKQIAQTHASQENSAHRIVNEIEVITSSARGPSAPLVAEIC